MAIRLGSIAYSNSLPVDFGLLSGEVSHTLFIQQGVPSELNASLKEGKLDISPVSALFFAEHAHELLMLPDLSISSESGVQSVLLFSRYPLEALNQKVITITSEGKSTPALLKIILKERYGVTAQYVEKATAWSDLAHDGQSDAFLVIGDDALTIPMRPRPYRTPTSP